MLLRGVWIHKSRSNHIRAGTPPQRARLPTPSHVTNTPLTFSVLRNGGVFVLILNLKTALVSVNGKVGNLATTGENRGRAETIARVRAILPVELTSLKLSPAIREHHDEVVTSSHIMLVVFALAEHRIRVYHTPRKKT